MTGDLGPIADFLEECGRDDMAGVVRGYMAVLATLRVRRAGGSGPITPNDLDSLRAAFPNLGGPGDVVTWQIDVGGYGGG